MAVPVRPRWACVVAALIPLLLAGCGESDAPDDAAQRTAAHPPAEIVGAEQALNGAYVPTLDPATMNDAEIRKAIGAGPRCVFRYTSSGGAVLAARTGPAGSVSAGAIKLNGNLVSLKSPEDESQAGRAGGFVLVAGPIRLTVAPEAGDAPRRSGAFRRRTAQMTFEIGEKLTVGYLGYLDCAERPPMETKSH